MPNCRDDADIMYRLLVQGVTDYAIYMLSPEGVVANWNAGAQRAKGYTADEIVGRSFSCFYAPEDRAAGLPERGLRTARTEGRFEAEGWRLRKDGSRFWAHVVIDAIHDDEGRFIGFAKITRDCTEKRASAVKLDAALGNLDLAMSNMAQALCLIDAEERVVLANERMHEILAMPGRAPLAGATIRAVLSEALSEAAALLFLRDHLRTDLGLHKPAISEIVHRERVLSVTTRRLATGGWVSTFVDVTERRLFENQIQHLAQHDPLTDLANRATLHRALTETLSSRPSARCAVLYIDLDRFKPINDTFGHAVGDRLLQEVARRLRRTVGAQDVIARLGGDEFALILTAEPEQLQGTAQQILTALNQPYAVKRLPIRIGASIGIAVAPPTGCDADMLLRNADLALYDAKKAGRNRYSYYAPAMGDGAAARARVEADLHRALERGEFLLHYQPIVRARTGATIGFEALLRWRRPDGVAMSPAEFIPVAEEAGLMPEIGAWILAQACREAVAWPAHLTVAVNVSATQLRSALFIHAVEQALAHSGLPPHRLEIEITETAVLENRELALSLLRRLRGLGVMIALDDFGTGYSSLSFVHTFPLTRIKIDRSFVQGLGQDPQATAIVRAIIGLSRSLGLAVTAEGVETEEQRRLLPRARGLDLQGYLFGRPEASARLDCTGEMRRPARRAGAAKGSGPGDRGHPEAA